MEYGCFIVFSSAVQWGELALYINLKICEEYGWELTVLSPHIERWLKAAYCFTVNILKW